jgi:hypothetical protein
LSRERNTPESPLDDEYEALRLLSDRSYRHGAYLCLNYRRGDHGGGSVRLRDLYKGPRIVVQHLGGYADLEVRREDITYLSERVTRMLLGSRLDPWHRELGLHGRTRATPH